MTIASVGGQRRCAIYTRKSTERGLDMNVTSLEAQRDICSSYIKCQGHRNWVELATSYDDGGFSGGSLERPALQRLLADVEDGRVDIIVIYKVDRLTRSLLDFVRLVEVLNRHEVSFACVTQTFDTSDSMGRLILNILLTFAQFERELMSDRLRDKKAATLRRGYFTGGLPPFGYLVDSGARLCIDDERAPIVRELYKRFESGWTIAALARDLAARNLVTRMYVSASKRRRGGQPITTAVIRYVLRNPIYTGFLVHRGEWILAEIDPLVTRELWDRVQEAFIERAPRFDHDRDFLTHLLHDERGRRMRIQVDGPARMNGFRYYRSEGRQWRDKFGERAIFVRADDTETAVKEVLFSFFRNPCDLQAAVMADQMYSQEIGKAVRRGPLAARRLECMGKPQFRQALLALIPRIEVHACEIKLFISTHNLKRFLGWDGRANFGPEMATAPGGNRVWALTSPCSLICGHARYLLPIEARIPDCASIPDERLASLVTEAGIFRDHVLRSRQSSLSEIAADLKVTRNYLVRVLRINYLAPDIQSALIDGTQPAATTRKSLMDAAMLLDWKLQRKMLGFEPARC